MKRSSIESFLVIVLFIIFSSAIAIIILQGAQTFDKIILEKEKVENFRIASSYINMVIVQNDSVNGVTVATDFLNNQTALVIKHDGDEAGLVTYIYYKDGYLWELYLDESEVPNHDFATKIVAVDGVSFAFLADKQAIGIDYIYNNAVEATNIQQIIALETR